MFLLLQLLIVSFVLIVIFLLFKHQYVWWEYLLQIAIPICMSLAVFKISTSLKENDIEYWSSSTVKVIHEERYQLYEQESYSCNCTTDKDGHQSCETCYRWVCNSYGPYYTAYNELGVHESISKSLYDFIRNKFKNEKITGQNGDSCLKGNIYESSWDGDTLKFQVFVQKKTCKNKVRFNKVYNSSENFPKEVLKQAYDYPYLDYIHQSHIIGWPNINETDIAENVLSYYAGTYGPKPRNEHGQIKPFIFVYRNVPEKMKSIQRTLLQQCNKNEFILLLCIDDNNRIKWYDAITYGPASCKNRMFEYLHDNRNANIVQITEKLVSVLKENWIRTEFTPINQFIDVNPGVATWVWSSILTCALSIGLVFLFAQNKFTNE